MQANFKRACEFIHQYYDESKQHESSQRIEGIKNEISTSGTYKLTVDELVYGCKLAWRNSNRCIGRLFWNSLKVKDKRELDSETEIFEAIKSHIKYAFNEGKIRSVISVFNHQDVKIYNQQLIRYAGYKLKDGSTKGDPEMLDFTKYCIDLGWEPSFGEFDVLPLVLQLKNKTPKVFEIPKEIIPEVNLEHPHFSWFKELQLKWYSVPIISNMILEIGGIQYQAAPFNGWYMSTEIASRNLADRFRYNKLPLIAEHLGLNTTKNRNLWKDHALLVLNEAVLYSFEEAGVQIVDHHSASEQFMKFVKLEQKSKREVTADWSWIVPPMSAAALEVFHHQWNNEVKSPNFFYRTPVWNSKDPDTRPHSKCPFHINSLNFGDDL
ncbi:nitric-oxide synthase [Marivirga sericea]|uniref:Nitric oxide synthase oxygenase n=1 Tax=Marivirga sericea TaxID=1028 RepID=A0A1X7LIN4_9BACT|nr:nitric oxide synthase oxygenase [Marivirga sericea]SMG53049.1 nitric-oxide synthase [Marivirga sericea]